MDILTAIIAIPFLAALTMLVTPPEKSALIKKTALFATILLLVASGYLVSEYLAHVATVAADQLASGKATYLFYSKTPWFKTFNINYEIGVDGISVAMILLTAIVIFCGVLISWSLEHRVKEFFVLLMVLVSGVFGVFVSIDLFFLFLFFEVAVLPMYLLIGIWGTGKKEYSAMKLTLMLMAGSALVMVGILALYYEAASFAPYGPGTFSIAELGQYRFSDSFQTWVFPCLFVGFGVIGALFPFHTWSPDGHASAPTAVSMLHAGVLMKLGGYGCLRVVYMLPEGAKEWALLFMALTTVNVVYGGLIAIRKKDLKYITAYSSVSHCGLVLFGLMTLTVIGIQGSVIQMFSHGAMTALFFALIGVIYSRTHTRELDKLGGLMSVMPFAGVCYFIAGFAALGLPGLAGFVAEITVFVGSWMVGSVPTRIMTVLACASVVITAVYVLRATTKMFFGSLIKDEYNKLPPITFSEKLSLTILCAVLFIIGIFPGWLISMIEYSLGPVMTNLMRTGI